ncbi:MAG: hypothetical protein ABIU09_05660 [Pyrinomonadaceae bacterium]
MSNDAATIDVTLMLHGVLLKIFGIGVLLVGEPGIGKSDTALDLIRSGHSLVADDAVIVSALGEKLVGTSPRMMFELLEVRGLGILNVRELFGESSVGSDAEIEFCIELVECNAVKEIDPDAITNGRV